MRIRVKVKLNDDGAWDVDLPIYQMVPESFLPIIPDVTHSNGVSPKADPRDIRLSALTCEVDVPDDIINVESGRPDIRKIRQIYSGQSRWDRDNRTLDI